jgi:hypothetical protein
MNTKILSLFSALLLSVASLHAASDKPNIVFVLCDDLGYGDVHVLSPEHGKIPTPVVDRLASEGMIFTDAHSGASVCSPTRYWKVREQKDEHLVFTTNGKKLYAIKLQQSESAFTITGTAGWGADSIKAVRLLGSNAELT